MRCVACFILVLSGLDTIMMGAEISRPQWPKDIRRAKEVTTGDRQQNRLEDFRTQLRTNGALRLDKSAPEAERTVPASLIRDAIVEQRKAFLANVIVEGRLDCVYAVFEKEIVIIDCRFKGEVDFRYATFRQNITLDGSTFEKGLNLGFAAADGNFSLRWTKFVGGALHLGSFRCQGFIAWDAVETAEKVPLYLDMCDVAKGMDFLNTKFGGSVSCFKGRFRGPVMLGGVRFDEGADFTGSTFDGVLAIVPRDPKSAEPEPGGFKGVAKFEGVNFKEGAQFSVDFNEANFEDASSDQELLFGAPDPLPPEWDHDGKFVFVQKASFVGLRAKRLVVAGFQFKGTADFSRITIEQDVRFKGRHHSQSDAMFLARVSFVGAGIGGQAVFLDCGFASDVDFTGSDVRVDLIFEEETDQPNPQPIFGGEALFNRVRVGDGLEFFSRRFDHPLQINGARIGGLLKFVGNFEGKRAPITFKKEVSLVGAEITRGILASRPTFEARFSCQLTQIGTLDFSGAEGEDEGEGPVFLDQAVFSGSRFDWVLFEGAVFKKVVRFDAMKIERAALFQDATFEGPVSFQASHLSGPAHFEGVEFRDVTFRNATFQSLSFRSTQAPGDAAEFRGKVDLRGCSYSHVEVDWRPLVARIEPYDRQAYSQLQKALYAAGEPNDAAEVYQARLAKEVNGQPLRWILYVVPWISAKPSLVARACVLVLAMGVLLFGVVPGSFEMVSSTAAADSGKAGAKKPSDTMFTRWIVRWSGALALSVRYFLPFDTPAGMNWAPTPGAGTIIATSLRILGWVLLAMIIAAVSGLFRATL